MERYQIAIYIRLSKEDDKFKEESNSITMQRILLQRYVAENFSDYDLLEFCDDGYTGTNFERPGMQEMLELVRDSKINCIVVKDFSRFARDYIELGSYLEQIFPFMGVRFISVNDNYDSKNYQGSIADIDVNFKNLLYDLYSKDLSQKVRSSLAVRKEKGQYVSGNCPLGYEKAPEDRHALLIAEDEAEVVRRIFSLTVEGYTSVEIARLFNKTQVKTPIEFKIAKGKTSREPKGDRFMWSSSTICQILRNEIYIGNIVQKKYTKDFVGGKNHLNPREDWLVTYNHHEPIIDRETWERVQELRKQRKRPNRYDEVGLFSGMLFCADCGHVMYQQRYQNKNRKQDCYICGSYKKRTRDCTAHFIRTDLLTAGVLSNLRQVTEYAAKHESRFVKLLIQQNEIGGKRKTAAATKQLEQAQERIAEVSRIIKRLYEDNVNGKISDERFMELSADYEQEQRELKDRAAALQEELDKSQAATVNAEKFMGIVRKHLAFEELTPTLLREMIEKIVVHECSYDENGTRRQDIEIYYSFVGKIDLPEA